MRLRETTVPADTESCDRPDNPRPCTRDPERGASAGDPGGPAFVRTLGGWVPAGVTSDGGKDPETGFRHSLFQYVSAHLGWICGTTGVHRSQITG